MKDVLINLQMALTISLRGVSMDDSDLDFDSLQQTSDDCRTNVGVCLGQYSQRLSDIAKAEAMLPEVELPAPNHGLGYSSSRSTRSTHSSTRDLRTPPDTIHDHYASLSSTSNTATVRPPALERKRTNSSASRRGYESRRPITPQSQPTYTTARVAIPKQPKERRVRAVPSHEVLTPPDEDTLHDFDRTYDQRYHVREHRGTGRESLADSGYAGSTYTTRRKANYAVPSMASSRSAESSKTTSVPVPNIKTSIAEKRRTRFGGISSQARPRMEHHEHYSDYEVSTLDDPTTSDEDDILSLRRPSSHALGIDEPHLASPTVEYRSASSVRSYVVALPDAESVHEPVSPVSPVSEEHSDQDSIVPSPELLPADTYRSTRQERQYDVDDSTPSIGSGEFGYATVYETSVIKPVESMPRELQPPRIRQPRQDSLSRLRDSRQIAVQLQHIARSAPQHQQEEQQASMRQRENRVRHHRAHPPPVQIHASLRDQQQRPPHVAYLQQEGHHPGRLVDLPLPPPPNIDNRPDSRSSSRHQRAPQAYKVFPAPPASVSIVRGAPRPPPNMALPPPPPVLNGPKWLAEAQATGLRPNTSPIPPRSFSRDPSPSTQPTPSHADEQPIEALPKSSGSGEPGPSEPAESDDELEVIPTVSPVSRPATSQRMVKIVPMHMAMYGGTYTGALPQKPLAPPMPVTLPLILPTDKFLLGFCKGAQRAFSGQSKAFATHSRPLPTGTISYWQCHKCAFQGPVMTVSKTVSVGKKGKEKTKEEKIYDPEPRASTVRGSDGETGGVRYKWAFLAKCHVPVKSMSDDFALLSGAGAKGEFGSFGCLFCCAEGVARGWVDKDENGKVLVHDGVSVMSGSTGSADTTKSGTGSAGKSDTPIFKDLERFMEHLEMHRKEDGYPGAEMAGRMKCVFGRFAGEGEEWEVNFLPLKTDGAEK